MVLFRIVAGFIICMPLFSIGAQQSILLSSGSITEYSGLRVYMDVAGYDPNYLPNQGFFVQASMVIRSRDASNNIKYVNGSSGILSPTNPPGKYQVRVGINDNNKGVVYQVNTPIFLGGQYNNYITFAITGPTSDAGIEMRCTATNPGYPNIMPEGAAGDYNGVSCGYPLGTWGSWIPVTGPGVSSTTKPSATWSGVYENSLTFEPGQTKRVLWGTTGNTSANITSSLSGVGMDDVELKGQCNGVINNTGVCEVTMKNVSWFGTRNAMLRINISLP